MNDLDLLTGEGTRGKSAIKFSPAFYYGWLNYNIGFVSDRADFSHDLDTDSERPGHTVRYYTHQKLT